MLSAPPAALARSVRACASVGGWWPAVAELGDGGVHEGAQVLGLGPVVPEAVAADHEPAVLGEVEVAGVGREVVGRVDAQPPGDRVGPGAGLRLLARHARAHLGGGERVVLTELTRRAVERVGQPVGPAVTDVAGDDGAVDDDGGDEGARRRAVDGGLAGGGGRLDDGALGRLDGLVEPALGPGDQGRRGCPRRGASARRARRGPRGDAARLAMWLSVELETPSQTTRAANDSGAGVGVQGHGVLVAAVPAADVADPGHPAARAPPRSGRAGRAAWRRTGRSSRPRSGPGRSRGIPAPRPRALRVPAGRRRSRRAGPPGPPGRSSRRRAATPPRGRSTPGSTGAGRPAR